MELLYFSTCVFKAINSWLPACYFNSIFGFILGPLAIVSNAPLTFKCMPFLNLRNTCSNAQAVPPTCHCRGFVCLHTKGDQKDKRFMEIIDQKSIPKVQRQPDCIMRKSINESHLHKYWIVSRSCCKSNKCVITVEAFLFLLSWFSAIAVQLSS